MRALRLQVALCGNPCCTQVAISWHSGDVLVEVVLCSHLYFCFWKTFTVGCGEQEEGDNCQCPDLDLLFSLLFFSFLVNL